MTALYNMSDLSANETGAPHPGTPFYVFVWVTILNAVVFLVGLVGNVLVIVVVTRVREMKTSTNFCLMNLSIADLLVLLICQPAALLEFYGQEKWVLGDFMCKYALRGLCLATSCVSTHCVGCAWRLHV